MDKILVNNICKSFGSKIVIANFSAEFDVGKMSVIMGESGCGKTTLLRLMMGLDKPDSGSLINIPPLKSAVFQEDRLCPEFGAVSNIKMVTGKHVSKSEVLKSLKRVGLEESTEKPISEFSGGMARRVAVVRALMAESDIIFLDEPFKGLDEKSKQLTVDFILQEQRSRTIIAVTHSLEEAAMLGGKIITMQKNNEKQKI